jgi:Amidases related to nicotinamidase
MRIIREDSAALLVDIQEKLLPAVHMAEETLAATVRLIKGLRILDVPIIPVRHYPKGMGDLAAELRNALGDYTPSDKITFSAWENAELRERIQSLGKKNLLVFGMESHVCVLQTVIDIANSGYNVVVVADCVASRRLDDKNIALRRAEKEGATLATSESILFELLREAGTDTFKKILALVK